MKYITLKVPITQYIIKLKQELGLKSYTCTIEHVITALSEASTQSYEGPIRIIIRDRLLKQETTPAKWKLKRDMAKYYKWYKAYYAKNKLIIRRKMRDRKKQDINKVIIPNGKI